MTPRAGALILLIVSVAGMVRFSRGLTIIDTVGLLASGVIAGASIAVLAAGRRRGR